MAPKKATVPSRSTPLAPQAVLQAQLHVLRHLLHTLLHTRGLYPAATFQQHVLYGVQGWRSRMPGVINHLDRAIEALEAALASGGRGLILLVFLDGEVGKERWLFDFRPIVDIAAKGCVSGDASNSVVSGCCSRLTVTCAVQDDGRADARRAVRASRAAHHDDHPGLALAFDARAL
jgi:hypothetical protein